MLAPLRLHILDFIVGTLPFLRFGKAFDALHHNTSVPGAVKNRYGAGLRQSGPEAPLIMELLFYNVRRRNRMHMEAQRVQCRRQSADSAALAGSIPALKADDYRNLRLEHFNLQLCQLFLILVELFLIFFLGKLLVGVNRAQHIVGCRSTLIGSRLGRHLHSLFDSIGNLGENLQTCAARIIVGNQMPGSVYRIGSLQHFFVMRQKFIVIFAFINRRIQITPRLAQGFGILGDIFLLLLR